MDGFIQDLAIKSFGICFLLTLHSGLPAQHKVDTSLTISIQDALFDSDKAFIRPDDSLWLIYLIDTSKTFDAIRFSLTGHTDEVGSDQYNEVLSFKRMKAVQNFLIRHGIDSTLIVSSYHGEKVPKANNLTESGKQKNRRVTVHLEHFVSQLFMTGKVVDDSTDIPLPRAQVFLKTKISRDTFLTDPKGLFQLSLPANTVFGLEATAPKYLAESRMLKVTPQLLKDTIEIRLSKLIPGKKINLEKLYFVGNKAILLRRSDPELSVLKELMIDHKEICVEIIGHVNYPNLPPVSKNTFEFNLSIARSKRIYEYLIEAGVDPSRMFYTGRGNWEMVYPKARDERKMQVNRRVELQVCDCQKAATGKNAVLDDISYNFY